MQNAAMAQWDSDSCQTLSDTDMETINCDELVMFDTVKPIYTNTRDIVVHYTFGKKVDHTPRDWVGLFRNGWMTTKDVSVSQWVPFDPVSAWQPRRRKSIFPQPEIENLEGDFQFLYITGQDQVVGVSESFKITEDASIKAATPFNTENLVQSMSLISLDSSSSSDVDQNKDEQDKKNVVSDHEHSKSLVDIHSKSELFSTKRDPYTLSDVAISTTPEHLYRRLRFASHRKDVVEEYEALTNFSFKFQQDAQSLLKEIQPNALPRKKHIDLMASQTTHSSYPLRPKLTYHPYQRTEFSFMPDSFRRTCLETYMKALSDSSLNQHAGLYPFNTVCTKQDFIDNRWSSINSKKPAGSDSSELDVIPVSNEADSGCESNDELSEVNETRQSGHAARTQEQRPKRHQASMPIFNKQFPQEHDEHACLLQLSIDAVTSDPDELPICAASLDKPSPLNMAVVPLFDVNQVENVPETSKCEVKKVWGQSKRQTACERGNRALLVAETLSYILPSDPSVSPLWSANQLQSTVIPTATFSAITNSTASTKLRTPRSRKRSMLAVNNKSLRSKRPRLSTRNNSSVWSNFVHSENSDTPQQSSSEEMPPTSTNELQERIVLLDTALIEALKNNADLHRRLSLVESELRKAKAIAPLKTEESNTTDIKCTKCQCIKKLNIDSSTDTTPTPGTKDAQISTNTLTIQEAGVQCTSQFENVSQAEVSLKTICDPPTTNTCTLVQQSESTIAKEDDTNLEKWQVATSKRMQRLRRIVAKKREEFARLRENVTNNELHIQILEARLRSVRATLCSETSKRMNTEKDLRELRVKFWTLIAARKFDAWGTFNSQKDKNLSAIDNGSRFELKAIEFEPKQKESHSSYAKDYSNDINIATQAKNVKKAQPGVISFKTFLFPSPKPNDVDAVVQAKDILPEVLHDLPANALDVSPNNSIFTPPPKFCPDLDIINGNKPDMSSVFKVKTSMHDTRTTESKLVDARPSGDKVTNVTVSLTAGCPSLKATTSAKRKKSKSKKRTNSAQIKTSTTKVRLIKHSASVNVTTDPPAAINRLFTPQEVADSKEKCAFTFFDQSDDSRPSSASTQNTYPSGINITVNVSGDMDEESSMWCPQSVSNNTSDNLTDTIVTQDKDAGNFGFIKTKGIVSGKISRNELARQVSAKLQDDTKIFPHCNFTAAPHAPLLSSFFGPIGKVISTPPRPGQACLSPVDIDLQQQWSKNLPRALHYDHVKTYNHSVNQQVRQGRCLTCGMHFSPSVDRYLIEEHILYHHAFTE